MGHLPRCRSTGIKYTKSSRLKTWTRLNPQSRYLNLSKSHSIFHDCIWFRTSLSPQTYCRLFQIQGSLWHSTFCPVHRIRQSQPGSRISPSQRSSYPPSSIWRSLAQDACKSGGTSTTTRTRASDDVCSILGGVWLVFSHRASGRHSDNFKDMAFKSFIVRIAGSALVLANSHQEKPMLIAESILQSVGLSPLLFEVSLVLLRWYVERFPIPWDLAFFPKTRDANDMSSNSGQSGETGPRNSI